MEVVNKLKYTWLYVFSCFLLTDSYSGQNKNILINIAINCALHLTGSLVITLKLFSIFPIVSRFPEINFISRCAMDIVVSLFYQFNVLRLQNI